MVSGLILLFYFPRALKALQTTCLFHSFTQALFSVLKCFLTVTHIQKCNGCIPLRQITFWHYSITLSAVPNIKHFNWVLLTVLRAKVRYQTYCRQKKMNPPDSFVRFAARGGLLYLLKKGFSQLWQLETGKKCPRCTLRWSKFVYFMGQRWVVHHLLAADRLPGAAQWDQVYLTLCLDQLPLAIIQSKVTFCS